MVKQFWSFFHKLYFHLFKQKVGKASKTFAKNIFLVYFGTAIAGFLGLMNLLIVAYFIGPEQYGKFNLVLATSGFLVIPMVFGYAVSSAKYLPVSMRRKSILSTIIFLFYKHICLFYLILFVLFKTFLSFYCVNNSFFQFNSLFYIFCALSTQ